MNAILTATAWVRNAFDLKPGELGDIYAAVSLAASVVGMFFATFVWILK